MRQAGYDAGHVAEFGMANATDSAIWSEAVSRSAVLVTKDRDFSLLRAAKRHGPIVLWVRVGNIDNRAMIRQFWARCRKLSKPSRGARPSLNSSAVSNARCARECRSQGNGNYSAASLVLRRFGLRAFF